MNILMSSQWKLVRVFMYSAALCLCAAVPGVARAAVPSCASALAKYQILRPISAGATGVVIEVSPVTNPNPHLAMKGTNCTLAGNRTNWQKELDNFANLQNVQFPSRDAPFFIKKVGDPFMCKGFTKSNGTDFSAELGEHNPFVENKDDTWCVLVLEKGVGGFPYGAVIPNGNAARTIADRPKDIKEAKAILYEIIYAHYLGFVKAGFQNWDLKEMNLLTGSWPANSDRLCLDWKIGSGRCINKPASIKMKDQIVKIIDFDTSTSGGIGRPELKRVLTNTTNSDARNFIKIWNNIKPVANNKEQKEEHPADGEAAFLALVEKADRLTPRSDLQQLPATGAIYTQYKAALEAILSSPFWGDLDNSLSTNCPAQSCQRYVIYNAF